MFLDLGTLFLDLYIFFGPNRIFFGPRVTKNVGDFLVFSGPCGDIFFGPACICAGPREFFLTAKLIVSELGFCFLDPGGKLHLYRRSHWAGCFWTLAPSFLEPAHVFFGPGTGWGEFRY